jgi:polyisoprenoid-binding protein YceI
VWRCGDTGEGYVDDVWCRRSRRWAIPALLLWAAVAAGAREGAGTAWDVSEDSAFYVQVFNDEGRIGSGFAHDHVIRATAWDAELRFDADDPASCRLSMTVPVEALAVDEPAMRRRLGYEGELDAEQRAEIRATMLGEDQLDAANHPEIRIEARDCERLRPGRYRADVAVTIRGNTADERVPLTVSRTPEGDRLRVRGHFPLRHSEVGMETYSAFLGSVANADEMRFVLHMLASRA